MNVRTELKKLLDTGLSPFGLQAMRMTTDKVRGLDPLLDLQWLLKGVAAPVIFDVGANDGETIQAFLKTFSQARVTAFEPFVECSEKLKRLFARNPNVRIENVALGSEKGSLRLNLYSGSNMNSLLEMDRKPENVLKDSFSERGAVEVPIQTLDGYCAEHGVPMIDVLKIDTQGYDLHVLKGASGLLKKHSIKVIMLEINFIPMYKEQATFNGIHEFLASLGYRLVDLYNHARHNGYTAWCDACYVAVGADDGGPQ